MPTTIVCPKCQTKLNLPETALGKQVRCPKCSTTLRAPAAPGAKSGSSQPAGLAAASKPASAPKPASSSAAGGKTTIRCPGCSKQLAVSASAAGKVVQCPQCSKKLRIPAAKGPASTGAARPAAPQAPVDPFGPPSPASGTSPAASSPFDFGPTPAAGPTSAGNSAPTFGGFAGGSGFPSAPASPPASPYSPPTGGYSRPQSSGGSSGRPPAFYIANGVLIALWGILPIVSAILRMVGLVIVISTNEIPGDAWPRLIGMAVGTLFGLILGIVMIRGGIGMAMRNSLTSARVAAVLAAIPCFGLCIFPFGIWACFLVFDDQARRDFGVR